MYSLLPPFFWFCFGGVSFLALNRFETGSDSKFQEAHFKFIFSERNHGPPKYLVRVEIYYSMTRQGDHPSFKSHYVRIQLEQTSSSLHAKPPILSQMCPSTSFLLP